MAQVYNKVYVDVRTETADIVTAVQKDANSRFLDVYLLDNGVPINLTGHEVRIYGKKYDGTEIYNSGTITEPTNGRCQFELTDQALALAQDLEMQIVIYYKNVQILQSLPFTIHVKKSLISKNAIESSNEYGALALLYQNLYEAYDLMTTMTQNMGAAGEIAAEYNVDTFWKMLELMASYMKVNLTDLLNTVLAEASVQGVIDRLGNTTDTGGTVTTGTVMGKLNKCIGNSEKALNPKGASVFLSSQVYTDYTILNIQGKGVFRYIYLASVCDYNPKIIIDGITYQIYGTNSSSYMGIAAYMQAETTNNLFAFIDIPFNSSLQIKITTTGSYSARTAKIAYALYE